MSIDFVASIAGNVAGWWQDLGDRAARFATPIIVASIIAGGLVLTALIDIAGRRMEREDDESDVRLPVRAHGLRAFISDTAVLAHRNLLISWRTPQLIIAAAVMPIMFVLLFRYVFGGAIHVDGYPNYVDYLIPGVIVQTALFGGSASANAVAEDLTRGVTDRYRSLPTHRGAILAARTFADVVRLASTMAITIGVGMLVGYRFHNGPLGVLGGLGVALFFGYACSWLFSWLGLAVRNVEAATMTAFVITFPLIFAASTFTSTATMPDWLRAFANTQPVTHVIDALRALSQGTGSALVPTVQALAWSAGILLVAVTLSLRRFRYA